MRDGGAGRQQESTLEKTESSTSLPKSLWGYYATRLKQIWTNWDISSKLKEWDKKGDHRSTETMNKKPISELVNKF